MFINPTAMLWENDKILTSKILEKSDYNIYWNIDNPRVINTNPKITPAGIASLNQL